MIQPLTFVVASSDADTLQELRGAISADRRARVIASSTSAEKTYDEVAQLRPLACIITLGIAPEAGLSLIRRIAADHPEMMVICASRYSSPDLILNSLRAGAREFLRLPVKHEEITTVLDRTAEVCQAQLKASKKRGRAIAVFSNKGGCGTSLIATNLAAALGTPTALIDLNLEAGSLDLFLGAKPRFSIADVVENRERIDDALLASYLVSHSTNLALLAAPSEASLAEDIKPANIHEVMELLQARYDYVVADLPHTFDANTLAALDQADDILLVLALDISAIRNAQRALAIFERLGYKRHKVRIIVNRWSKQIDLDLQQVERFLGERVVGFIQSDYRAAVNSLNLGQPLVEFAGSSPIAADIKRIAGIITETAPSSKKPRKKILGSLFHRQAGPTQLNLRTALGQSIDALQRSES